MGKRGYLKGSRTGGRWFDPRLGQHSFRGLMISHCDRIHSSLTAFRCLCGYVGKQPVAWKEYFGEYWLKEPQERMDMCTGRLEITDNDVKHYTINQLKGSLQTYELSPTAQSIVHKT